MAINDTQRYLIGKKTTPKAIFSINETATKNFKCSNISYRLTISTTVCSYTKIH